ncbi:MAG: hypothetical protein ACR2ND_01060 [Solirubrobacteraceae bacterium]
MAGVVHIPWYATGFRGDQLEQALTNISTIATRYGASGYIVYRARDDRYKLLQILNFERKADFDRYWNSPELVDFRISAQGWFQVPVVYNWQDVIAEGRAVVANGA